MSATESRLNSPWVLRLLDVGRQDTGEDLREIDQRTVFILSTGRTGTQYLANHLDRHRDIRALHEPRPSRGLRFWTIAYLEGAVERSEMTRTLRRYRTGFFQEMHEPVYVESNNFLAGFAESLIDEFNKPILIHVVRDPRTYVRSAINNGAATGLKGLANRFISFAHLRLESDSGHPVIRRSARYWALVNDHLRTVGETYSAYHRFRYEDIFDPASAELERLIDIAGGDTHSLDPHRPGDPVNVSTHALLPPWEDWSSSQRQVVVDSCGGLMAHFGYT